MAKMIPMDIESIHNMAWGLENIIMLKIFHDLGVDVSNFSNWNATPGYDDPTDDIFIDGLLELFEDVTVLREYDDEEELRKMVEDGELDSVPEMLIIIQDKWIQKLLHHQYDAVLKEIESKGLGDCEAKLLILPSKKALAVVIFCRGYYHSLVEDLGELWKGLIQMEQGE